MIFYSLTAFNIFSQKYHHSLDFKMYCFRVIHNNLFKIMYAINLFPVYGYIMFLFSSILYYTYFTFICFAKCAYLFHLFYFVTYYQLVKLKFLDHLTLNIALAAATCFVLKQALTFSLFITFQIVYNFHLELLFDLRSGYLR